MGIAHTYRIISANRLNNGRIFRAVLRVARWQVRSRLARRKVVCRFVNDTRLSVARGMTGATGNIYSGLDEPDEMGFLLHTLRADDTFVDLGANVGAYTVLAAGVIGARTVCFEPVPSTFADLADNIELNGIGSRVEARNIAIGAAEGTLQFSNTHGPANRVLRAGDDPARAISVAVQSLDDALAGEVPTLMKVDIEGYEGPAIAGGGRTLADRRLLAVIMEIGKHNAQYGYDETALRQQMRDFGFTLCRYDPVRRVLEEITAGFGENTIFVRDLVAARARIAAAPRFRLVNGSI